MHNQNLLQSNLNTNKKRNLVYKTKNTNKTCFEIKPRTPRTQ